MGQAGAADQAMGRVFVVQRGQYPAFAQGLAVALFGAVQATLAYFGGQAVLLADRGQGQFAHGVGITHDLDQVAFNYAYVTLAWGGFKLDQAHAGSCVVLVGMPTL
ncbi:hypothetical protein D3C80_1546100 [compost metagenome]